MNILKHILISMRPKQWVKNLFIFAPIIFSLHFLNINDLQRVVLTFILFSMVTGSIYLINDSIDVKSDRQHPRKRKRPIASGNLNTKTAVVAAIIILIISLIFIFLINKFFFYIAVFYIVLNVFYSIYLKKIVILDVLIIALGFVLRVMIGGVVVKGIELSPWILIITFILTTFLGLMKRRQELVRVEKLKADNKTVETRKTLNDYSLNLLDQLISITTATTLISYIIYVLDPKIQEKFHTDKLFFTVPFVLFGIFRYLYLAFVMDRGESPEEILFTDIPFAVNIVLWVLSFIGIIYYKI